MSSPPSTHPLLIPPPPTHPSLIPPPLLLVLLLPRTLPPFLSSSHPHTPPLQAELGKVVQGRTEIIGNKTEGAMIMFLRELGGEYKALRDAANVGRRSTHTHSQRAKPHMHVHMHTRARLKTHRCREKSYIHTHTHTSNCVVCICAHVQLPLLVGEEADVDAGEDGERHRKALHQGRQRDHRRHLHLLHRRGTRALTLMMMMMMMRRRRRRRRRRRMTALLIIVDECVLMCVHVHTSC
eukprot:2388524-Rhodomonas_salina.1